MDSEVPTCDDRGPGRENQWSGAEPVETVEPETYRDYSKRIRGGIDGPSRTQGGSPERDHEDLPS